MRATAIAAKGHPPGHAFVTLTGLGPNAAPKTFAIVREGFASPNLGPQGFQVAAAQLAPLAVRQDPDGATLLVGPQVCRWLEPGPVTIRIPGKDGPDGREAAMFWPDDIATYDGSWRDDPRSVPPTPQVVQPVAPPAPTPPPPQPTPPPPPPAPPPPPPPAPPPPPVAPPPATERKTPMWPLLAGLLLLVLAIGGGVGAWFWVMPGEEREPVIVDTQRPDPPPTVRPDPPPTRPDPTPGPTTGPSQQAGQWPEAADALSPRDVVGQAPNVDALLAVARRRQQQGRHEDALLLFLELADRNVAAAMTALGRMYSPVDFPRGQPFNSPDPRQAALFLRRATQAGDPAAISLRAALRQWLEARAAEGNPTARETLAEFW